MQDQQYLQTGSTIYGQSIVRNVEMRQAQASGPQAVGTAVYPPPKNTRDLDTYPGDPVFEYLGDRNGTMVLESCLNGILVPNQVDADGNREYLYQNLLFRGFSVSAVRWEGRATSAIVAQVDGLKVVVNTGTHKIEGGDVVCWQLPAANRLTPMCDHRSLDYRTLELVPMTELEGGGLIDSDITALLNDPMVAQVVIQANAAADVTQVVRNNFRGIMKLASLAIGHVVGTAMSGAEPGESFTILINGGAKQQIAARLIA